MVRVAVIGAGILGIKLAGYLAYRGHEVRVYDSNPTILNTVNQKISEDARICKEDGIMANANLLGDIYCFSNIEDAVREALFIFECIPEDITLKRELFKRKLDSMLCSMIDYNIYRKSFPIEISQHCNDKAILATNTMRLN